MGKTDRRGFLTGGMMAAGWAAVATVPSIAASGASRPADRPPSHRFLDAVRDGDLARVRELLAADPGLLYARHPEGRSAFAVAKLHRQDDTADLLREHGYEPDLHESALALDWPRFEQLAGTTPGAVNQNHAVGGTAMYAAAFGGAGTQIWRVYRYGGEPDVDPRGEAGYTPVRAALEHPDLPTAELTVASLLSNGASAGGVQPRGSSALHEAARRGSVDLVELLIRKGADVAATDEARRTPAELAGRNGHGALVELLRRHRDIPRDHSTSRLAYDVDGGPYRAPDLTAFSGKTLGGIVERSHGNVDATRSAIERHPELAHARSTTTEGAVEAGAHMGRRDIVDLLLEHGAPYSLPTAVMRNDLERARALLEEDPLRVHERGAHDFPLLWYPVIGKGLYEMAELLFEFGAEVERQHWLGTTALHYAVLGGDVDMVELLIERGADVDRIGRKFDAAGITPLRLAESRERDDVVRLLRERGATR
jgi:ankyrin repeat protein